MNNSVSNFVKSLAAKAPDDVNGQENLRDDFERQRRAFTLLKKSNRSLSNNIIIHLMEEYDCSSLGLISNISFNEEITETENYILFGWLWGEDPLAIDKKSGEVVSLVYWDYDEIGFYCAQDSNTFLQAFLIHGVSPIGRIFGREEDFWDYNIKKANEAFAIAGGNKYSNFWMSLYPTDDGKEKESNKGGFLN